MDLRAASFVSRNSAWTSPRNEQNNSTPRKRSETLPSLMLSQMRTISVSKEEPIEKTPKARGGDPATAFRDSVPEPSPPTSPSPSPSPSPNSSPNPSPSPHRSPSSKKIAHQTQRVERKAEQMKDFVEVEWTDTSVDFDQFDSPQERKSIFHPSTTTKQKSSIHRMRRYSGDASTLSDTLMQQAEAQLQKEIEEADRKKQEIAQFYRSQRESSDVPPRSEISSRISDLQRRVRLHRARTPPSVLSAIDLSSSPSLQNSPRMPSIPQNEAATVPENSSTAVFSSSTLPADETSKQHSFPASLLKIGITPSGIQLPPLETLIDRNIPSIPGAEPSLYLDDETLDVLSELQNLDEDYAKVLLDRYEEMQTLDEVLCQFLDYYTFSSKTLSTSLRALASRRVQEKSAQQKREAAFLSVIREMERRIEFERSAKERAQNSLREVTERYQREVSTNANLRGQLAEVETAMQNEIGSSRTYTGIDEEELAEYLDMEQTVRGEMEMEMRRLRLENEKLRQQMQYPSAPLSARSSSSMPFSRDPFPSVVGSSGQNTSLTPHYSGSSSFYGTGVQRGSPGYASGLGHPLHTMDPGMFSQFEAFLRFQQQNKAPTESVPSTRSPSSSSFTTSSVHIPLEFDTIPNYAHVDRIFNSPQKSHVADARASIVDAEVDVDSTVVSTSDFQNKLLQQRRNILGGQSGSTPANPIDTQGNVPERNITRSATALYAYDATDSQQLSIRPGDKLNIIRSQDDSDGWYQATNSEGKSGIVPSSYVRIDG